MPPQHIFIGKRTGQFLLLASCACHSPAFPRGEYFDPLSAEKVQLKSINTSEDASDGEDCEELWWIFRFKFNWNQYKYFRRCFRWWWMWRIVMDFQVLHVVNFRQLAKIFTPAVLTFIFYLFFLGIWVGWMFAHLSTSWIGLDVRKITNFFNEMFEVQLV